MNRRSADRIIVKSNAALRRFEQRIDMSAINTIIDTTPCITDIQKSFFKEMLKARKEKILDISYGKLHMREQSTPLKTAWINSIAVLDDAKSSSDQTIETNYFGS